jgi:hypothetical protein
MAKMSTEDMPSEVQTKSLGWAGPVVAMYGDPAFPDRLSLASYSGSFAMYKQIKVNLPRPARSAASEQESSGTEGQGELEVADVEAKVDSGVEAEVDTLVEAEAAVSPQHESTKPEFVDPAQCPGLEQGSVFASEEQVQSFIKSYCNRVRAAFTCTSNGKRQMRFLCKHHTEIRAPRGQGIRKLQRVNDLGCGARILFTKQISGDIKLTSFSETHSHLVSEDIYRMDTDKITEADEELIRTLVSGNCQPQNIRSLLRSERDTRVTIKAVRRAIHQMGPDKGCLEGFNSYLDQLTDKGAKIHHDIYPDGNLRFLTISTQKMQRAYLGADPPAVQCDTTFNFEASGTYQLLSAFHICLLSSSFVSCFHL